MTADAASAALDALLHEYAAAPGAHAVCATQDVLSIEHLARQLCRLDTPLTCTHRCQLLQTCRKLEVARRLRSHYRTRDFRALDGCAGAPAAVVDAVLAGCLRAYRESHDLRLLNTVFKVVLVGLIEPADALDPRLLPIAEALLWEGSQGA